MINSELNLRPTLMKFLYAVNAAGKMSYERRNPKDGIKMKPKFI
jgi:hypothetical protein